MTYKAAYLQLKRVHGPQINTITLDRWTELVISIDTFNSSMSMFEKFLGASIPESSSCFSFFFTPKKNKKIVDRETMQRKGLYAAIQRLGRFTLLSFICLSLKAQIPASKLKSQPQSSNPSLLSLIHI